MKRHANGIEIHYDLTGPEQADVVTLSHSLMADLSMWDPQLTALESFRVLRYDLRGHGNSEVPQGSYELSQLADDLLGLMNELGIECTHFVGASLGGMVGLQIATTHPDRLASLTLCNTRGHCSDSHAAIRQKNLEAIQSDGMQSVVEPTLKDWFSPKFLKGSSDRLAKASAMIEQGAVPGIVGCTDAMLKQNHTPLLSQIKLPCLVVVGEDDPVTPLKEAFDLHVGLDGSDMVVIPKTRHLATYEAADAFNDVLVTFLKQYS